MVAKFDLIVIAIFIVTFAAGLFLAKTIFDYFAASLLAGLTALSLINLQDTAESKSMIRDEIQKIRERFGHLLD